MASGRFRRPVDSAGPDPVEDKKLMAQVTAAGWSLCEEFETTWVVLAMQASVTQRRASVVDSDLNMK